MYNKSLYQYVKIIHCHQLIWLVLTYLTNIGTTTDVTKAVLSDDNLLAAANFRFCTSRFFDNPNTSESTCTCSLTRTSDVYNWLIIARHCPTDERVPLYK